MDVISLLEKYFPNRWRKDLKQKYKFISSSFYSLSGDKRRMLHIQAP